ncbi:MAG: helix-turn-helix transcriptional regulator [Alphaproteobacteria bacterium]
MCGLSRSTRWRLERTGEFPARKQITRGAVGWSLNEVSEWVKARPAVVMPISSCGPRVRP